MLRGPKGGFIPIPIRPRALRLGFVAAYIGVMQAR